MVYLYLILFIRVYTALCQDVDATEDVASNVEKSSLVKAVAPLLLFSLFTK
jgi:hypothetical protein